MFLYCIKKWIYTLYLEQLEEAAKQIEDNPNSKYFSLYFFLQSTKIYLLF